MTSQANEIKSFLEAFSVEMILCRTRLKLHMAGAPPGGAVPCHAEISDVVGSSQVGNWLAGVQERFVA